MSRAGPPLADIPILDAHVHWWDLETNPYPWLTHAKPTEGGLSGVDAIARTYLPEHYSADACGYDMAGFVHVQAEWDRADPVGETIWLEALADRGALGNRPLGIVAFADLGDPEVEAMLERQAAHGRVRGIRQMLNYLPDNPSLCWADRDYLADPVWCANVRRLTRYGLRFDAMCFAEQMPALATLASDNAETLFILEHAGMPHDHSADGTARWRRGMNELAEHDNVVVKISGLGNTIPNWTEALIRPYVEQTIETFGTNRVMFASNFPTDRQFSDISSIFDAFGRITRQCSDDETADMFRRNAISYYDL